MVFHFFERIFGNNGDPKSFFSDRRYSQLVEEGFSEEEAKNLAWLYTHQTSGKIIGMLGGFAVIYVGDPYYKSLMKVVPRLYYQPWIGTMLKLGVVFVGLQIGDYWATSRREGANYWFSNIYNNNYYIRSKEEFLRNFETFNRKFTEEEIEKFNLSHGVHDEIKRKWIYNPYIHGEDETAFRQKIEKIKNKTPIYNNIEIKQKILEENLEKINFGEHIELSPYSLINDVDKNGVKTQLDKNPILNHYKNLN